jgi:autotransporter-associated beta strand protein
MNPKKRYRHSRKSWLAAALFTAPTLTSSAQIVAGWDTYLGSGADGFPIEAPVLATGVTASFVTTSDGGPWVIIDERGASSDGTWGTLVGPPAADTTVGTSNDQNLELSNATTGGTITLTLNNNSGADIALNAFHMDALAFRPKAARTYTLDVLAGGAITAGNVYSSGDQEIKSQGGLPPDNDQGVDIDHDLSFLADSTLEDGGTVEFLLTFSGGAGDGSGGHDLWIDNLAISSSTAGSNQLAITAAPASATAGTDFSVTVQAQDSNGSLLAGGVSEDTEIVLTTADGNGVLSGNTATIPTGSNTITFDAVQYTAAENMTLVASQTSGDLLVPSGQSSPITINAGAASVVSVESANDGSGTAIGNTSFRINDPADTLDVFAISRDSVGNFIAFETSATFTLENSTDALDTGDLINNQNGSATFTARNLGTGIIRATVAGLTDGDSGLITVEEPQNRWIATGNGSWGTPTNWLDSNQPFFDNTTDLFFMDEFAITAQSFINGERTIRSLNITEFADPTVTQPGFGIRFLQNNSAGNATSLTMDTDSLVDPAEINIAAGAEINVDIGNVNNGFIADLPENYGNLILADPLRITHLGTGVLTFSRPIAEPEGMEESMSVTIDPTSTGTVSFIAANTYTGPTTVNGGILRLRNGQAINDEATLAINNAVVDIREDESVGNLFIDGVRQAPGIYGSTASLAPLENQQDTNFSGPGTITVLGVATDTGAPEIVGIITSETSVTLSWTSNPGDTYSIFFSTDLRSFDDELDDGIPATTDADVTAYTFPLTLLGADVEKAFFRVVKN